MKGGAQATLPTQHRAQATLGLSPIKSNIGGPRRQYQGSESRGNESRSTRSWIEDCLEVCEAEFAGIVARAPQPVAFLGPVAGSGIEAVMVLAREAVSLQRPPRRAERPLPGGSARARGYRNTATFTTTIYPIAGPLGSLFDSI